MYIEIIEYNFYLNSNLYIVYIACLLGFSSIIVRLHLNNNMKRFLRLYACEQLYPNHLEQDLSYKLNVLYNASLKSSASS